MIINHKDSNEIMTDPYGMGAVRKTVYILAVRYSVFRVFEMCVCVFGLPMTLLV